MIPFFIKMYHNLIKILITKYEIILSSFFLSMLLDQIYFCELEYQILHMSKEQKYTKGFVTSIDGTIIGYRKMGSCPGIIIMHGGVNASQHFMTLGTALA